LSATSSGLIITDTRTPFTRRFVQRLPEGRDKSSGGASEAKGSLDLRTPCASWMARAGGVACECSLPAERSAGLPPRSASTGPAEVFEFPMSDRDPVERWSFGRFTLLGAAAHPMYPIGSNGASQAILDAAVLSQVLAGAEDVPAALREYEARRLGPTAAIVLSDREMGPEVVMQMSEERAPDGFDRVEEIFRPGELEEVARR
jgi:2-polyprenyl-6-methoxyphenol hydroxylase-like FAD-dependent oxidoreductase